MYGGGVSVHGPDLGSTTKSAGPIRSGIASLAAMSEQIQNTVAVPLEVCAARISKTTFRNEMPIVMSIVFPGCLLHQPEHAMLIQMK
jgi:hypothetical protein